MTSRRQIFEAAREELARANKARSEYANLDEIRWAAATNPFEAWADYSARIPERNACRKAIRDAESALRVLSSRRGHVVVEDGEAA
ncbi:hypothetical protein ABXK61_16155 [Burkholderia sola]|uniref:hypothetical protein n=1 Tax=Burkholderia TaxID=32008 RepID=UPI001AE50CF7|nr:hypothetical protein [Burkholderia sp. AcTa6-5]MBP0714839.1 hypothetical protein [Burkholderia sp. AcTa6-5]